MGFLTGKSESKSVSNQTSSSSNKAYDYLQGELAPTISAGTGINSSIRGLLGLSPGGLGYEDYKNSTGYNFMFDEGSRAITNSRAASGLLNSGSTLKALTKYGQNTGASHFNQYLSQLFGLQGNANQAASILGGTGGVANSTGTSTSTSTQREGLGGLIGQIGGAVAMSDRRLKQDVRLLGEIEKGLNLYEYNYVDGTGPFVGVMADEVENTYPEALGPVIQGYKSVDYGRLKNELV